MSDELFHYVQEHVVPSAAREVRRPDLTVVQQAMTDWPPVFKAAWLEYSGADDAVGTGWLNGVDDARKPMPNGLWHWSWLQALSPTTQFNGGVRRQVWVWLALREGAVVAPVRLSYGEAYADEPGLRKMARARRKNTGGAVASAVPAARGVVWRPNREQEVHWLTDLTQVTLQAPGSIVSRSG